MSLVTTKIAYSKIAYSRGESTGGASTTTERMFFNVSKIKSITGTYKFNVDSPPNIDEYWYDSGERRGVLGEIVFMTYDKDSNLIKSEKINLKNYGQRISGENNASFNYPIAENVEYLQIHIKARGANSSIAAGRAYFYINSFVHEEDITLISVTNDYIVAQEYNQKKVLSISPIGHKLIINNTTPIDVNIGESAIISANDKINFDPKISGNTIMVLGKGAETFLFNTFRKVEATKTILRPNLATQKVFTKDEDGFLNAVFKTEAAITEDFETSMFNTKFKWNSNYSSTNGFSKRSDYKHSGTSSGYMGTSSTNRTMYSETKVTGSKVGFWYIVSSERNYDWFSFKINGTQKLRVSGTTMSEMAYVEYELDPTKESTLRFEYKTDSSGSAGKYGYFIDDLSVISLSDSETIAFVSEPLDATMFTKDAISLNLVDYTSVGAVTSKNYYSLDNGATYIEFTEIDKSQLNSSTIFKVEFTRVGTNDSIKFKAIEAISGSKGIPVTLTCDTKRAVKSFKSQEFAGVISIFNNDSYADTDTFKLNSAITGFKVRKATITVESNEANTLLVGKQSFSIKSGTQSLIYEVEEGQEEYELVIKPFSYTSRTSMSVDVTVTNATQDIALGKGTIPNVKLVEITDAFYFEKEGDAFTSYQTVAARRRPINVYNSITGLTTERTAPFEFDARVESLRPTGRGDYYVSYVEAKPKRVRLKLDTKRTTSKEMQVIFDTDRFVSKPIRVTITCSTKRCISMTTSIQANTKRATSISKAIEFETFRITRTNAKISSETTRRVNKVTQLSIDTKRRTLTDFSLMFDTSRKSALETSLIADTQRTINRMIVSRVNAKVSSEIGDVRKRVISIGFGYKLFKATTSLVNDSSDIVVKKYNAKTGDYIENIPYAPELNGENGKYAYKIDMRSRDNDSYTFTLNSIYADIKIEAIPFTVAPNTDDGLVAVPNDKTRVIQAASDTWFTESVVNQEEEYPIVVQDYRDMAFEYSGMTAAEGKHYAFVAYYECDNTTKVVRTQTDTQRVITHRASISLNFDTIRRTANSTALVANTKRNTTVTANTISDLKRTSIVTASPVFDTLRETYKNIPVSIKVSTTRAVTISTSLVSDTKRATAVSTTSLSDTHRTTNKGIKLLFDTERAISETPTYVVNLTASTKRGVITTTRTVTDTKRVTIVPVNILADTEKRTCGTVNLIADVARGTILPQSVNADTMRATSINNTTSFDTERVYGIGVNTCFNALRTVYVSQKVTAKTKRAISATQSSVFDLERKLVIQHTASSDTMRTLVTGKTVNISLDTSREVVKAVNLTADTLRKLSGIRIEVKYDLARSITAPISLIADTSRLTQNIIATSFNTHRTPMCDAQDIKQVLEIDLIDMGSSFTIVGQRVKNSLVFELEAFELEFDFELV